MTNFNGNYLKAIGDIILKVRYGKKYNALYDVACDRHQGDLEMWRQMDKTNKGFRNLEKEILGCCGKMLDQKVGTPAINNS